MRLVSEVFGRGPNLVMLPGWAMPARVLRPWAQQLSADWRVHLVELPGQGASTDAWPALAGLPAALAAALPEDAVWLGWSLGGQLLAAAAAHAAPAALCLVCSSPRFCNAPGWSRGVEPEQLQSLRKGLSADPRRALNEFSALLAGAGGDDRAAVRGIKRTQSEYPANVPALAAGLDALEALDLRAALPALAMPACWIGGERDPLVPPRAVRWAAAQMPEGRACVLPGAGHLPFLTHAAAVESELAGLRGTLGLQ